MRYPRRTAHLLVITAMLAMVMIPPVHAHSDAAAATDLTVEARERDDCPPDRAFCFEVTHGALSDLAPDTTVRLTFVNEGVDIHNIAITRLRDADPDRTNTPMQGMFAGTAEEVAPNASQTFFFHVPADAAGLYLWCHVVGHEAAGMWLAHTFTHTEIDTGGDEVPGPGSLLALAAALAAAFGLTRRRRSP